MKNILIIAVLFSSLAILGGAAPTEAATTCTILNPCPSNGDPMKIGMQWGLTGEQTPQVKAGVFVIDEAGNADQCPSWYGRMGCFDITRTQYYRDSMIETARQLKELGFVPTAYTYWLQFVR